MKYPNAYQGIKKLFTAEILQIIAGICMFIAAIAGIVAVAGVEVSNSDEELAVVIGGGVLVAAIFMAAFGVLSIISTILLLVGLKRAGRDEESFQKGFTAALASLILVIAASVLSAINGGNNIFDNLALVIANILEIIAMLFVTKGIESLAEDYGESKIAGTARTVFGLFAGLMLVESIMNLVSSFLQRDPAMASSSGVILLISSVVGIVAYIIYIVLLARTKKMLSK